jgi:hypothetical protein
MQVKLSNGDDVMPSSINEAVTPIEIVYDCTNIPGKPSNLYYHAGAFFEKLSSFLGSAADSILIPPVIISNASLQPDENGETENANALIRISAGNGCYSSALCHEMTHLFIYNILNNNTMAPTGNNLHKAMNEAFPSYFPCVYRSNSIYRSYLYTKDLSDSTLTVESVHNNNLENYGLTLNEEFYSSYFNRFPISSAWWSLRNNPVFGLPDPVTNVKAFDNLLVYVLKNRVASNDSTRYKPRYFYNLLMKEIATDTHSWGLNDRQLAIKDAYNARGLHFYPKVESISGGQKGKNIFGLNEPVHVKVSDCPQNTRINIYVVKHGDYTYTDGATISTLSNYFPIGFTPHTTAITDPNGEWSGLIWNIPASGAVGDYDIIVDIGSPTSPDGVIHYAFSGANVMDGFDGRLQPGFTVLDDGIDVVVATQSSWVDTDVLSRKH